MQTKYPLVGLLSIRVVIITVLHPECLGFEMCMRERFVSELVYVSQWSNG